MKALASFILRGFSPAMLVVVAGAVLALVFPLFSLISGAAVGLITLRKGPLTGLVVIAASCVFIGLLSYYSLNSFTPAITMLGVLWLPVWIVAWVLREFRSLPLAMTVSAGMGMLVIIAIYLMVGDVSEWWYQQLQTVFEPAIAASGEFAERGDVDSILLRMSGLMTGIVAAGMVLNTLVCVFLARGWQAMLFNPGGFRNEFYELRFGKAFTVITLVLMALTLLPLTGIGLAASDMMIVALSLFVIQGLAVVHAIIAKRQMNIAWLVALYVVPFVFLPQLIAAIGIVGLIDSWVGFRQRVAAKTT